jgi:tankyrase
MNATQRAAFELRLSDLKGIARGGSSLDGTLLSACSTHEPNARAQVAVIRHLVKCGVSVNEIDKNGVTPLHRAVRFRSPAAVKELIAQGADVNATDRKSKSTPLHRAVTNTGAPTTAGKAESAIQILKLLLSNGANPKIKNRLGRTPIDYVKIDEMNDVFSKYTAK